MSSGTKGSGDLGGGGYQGSGFYRNWAGANGKTEALPGGYTRAKWNNYAFVHATRFRPSNLWRCINGNTGLTYYVPQNVEFQFLGQPLLSSGEILSAQAKLARKVKGHSFNLAVNAAQGRQLGDMVVSNLGKLGRSILALKRGDFATAARQLGARPRTSKLKANDISGRWLELQYGWLPALSDTYEAAKAYEVITSKPRTSTVRAGISAQVNWEGHLAGSFATARRTCKYRISYIYEMTEQLTTARTLGLTDPLSVAWEVIPYSFVVDWFIPIGTYLEALNVVPFLTGRCMTTKSWVWDGEAAVNRAPLPGTFGGQYCISAVSDGPDICRSVVVVREVTSGLPGGVAFPSFNQGLRDKRIFNAIALAAQRFLS